LIARGLQAMIKTQVLISSLGFLNGRENMKFFAAFLMMKDIEKNASYRPQHMEFLALNEKAGKIFARGRFADNSGGMVIYIASSFEEAETIAKCDPLVISGARTLELHEWDMKVAPPV
jgi:uncharacterized protein